MDLTSLDLIVTTKYDGAESLEEYFIRLNDTFTGFKNDWDKHLVLYPKKVQLESLRRLCLRRLNQAAIDVKPLYPAINEDLELYAMNLTGYLEGNSREYNYFEKQVMSSSMWSLKFLEGRDPRVEVIPRLIPNLATLQHQKVISDATQYTVEIFDKVEAMDVQESLSSQTQTVVLKTTFTVGEIALLARCMVEAGMFPDEDIIHVLRKFASCFGIEDGRATSAGSLKNHYYEPSVKEVNRFWEKVTDMRAVAHKINSDFK